ncbi:MAG: META domain-containing protein [Pseudomonadota bacterium]
MRGLAVLVALVALAACGKDETIAGRTTPQTVWTLVEMDEDAISATFTIQFDVEGASFGQADCNRFNTTQTAPYPWIEFGPIAATKALCANSDIEQRFFAALGNAETVEIAGDTLLISGPQTILTFKSNG